MKKSIIRLVKLICNFFKNKCPYGCSALIEHLIPTIEVETKYGQLSFVCTGTLTYSRAKRVLVKEPETVEWIESANNGDVFWDIGANIGIFSLYAAIKGCQVLAFEPMPSNYYTLTENILVNGFSDKIAAYPIALSSKTALGHLEIPDLKIGKSGNSFVTTNVQSSAYNLAMLGFSIDSALNQFNFPFPNFIKIDVDGIEGEIIKGASKTMTDPRLKSILVELDIRKDEAVKKEIESAGFKIKLIVNNNKPIKNHIFTRT